MRIASGWNTILYLARHFEIRYVNIRNNVRHNQSNIPSFLPSRNRVSISKGRQLCLSPSPLPSHLYVLGVEGVHQRHEIAREGRTAEVKNHRLKIKLESSLTWSCSAVPIRPWSQTMPACRGRGRSHWDQSWNKSAPIIRSIPFLSINGNDSSHFAFVLQLYFIFKLYFILF